MNPSARKFCDTTMEKHYSKHIENAEIISKDKEYLRNLGENETEIDLGLVSANRFILVGKE